jgi:hypothetical protein
MFGANTFKSEKYRVLQNPHIIPQYCILVLRQPRKHLEEWAANKEIWSHKVP